MFGPKTSISVSIANGYDYTKGESRHYMKPQHTWMLSVASHKGLFSSGSKDQGSKNYSASWDASQECYRIQPIGKLNLGIVGNILVTSSSDASPDRISRLLDEGLHKDGASMPSEAATSEVSEQWMRMALHDLQTFKIIPFFDVDEFMTLAHGYLTKRLEPESGGKAPAVMPFDELVKQPSKKSKGTGFRISYPTANSNSRNGDKLYGGLM